MTLEEAVSVLEVATPFLYSRENLKIGSVGLGKEGDEYVIRANLTYLPHELPKDVVSFLMAVEDTPLYIKTDEDLELRVIFQCTGPIQLHGEEEEYEDDA